jgi:hypothetical protein
VLTQHPDRARLVTSTETDVEPTTSEMVGDRDVFGEPRSGFQFGSSKPI